MKPYVVYVAAVFCFTLLLVCPADAGEHHWGIGARSHVDHSAFDALPFGDGDMGYGLVYEYHDLAGLWRVAVDYTPDATGTNGVDSVLTPQLNLIFQDQWLHAGVGIMDSYVRRDDGENDWLGVYWQFLLGVGVELASLRFNLDASYVFEDWDLLEEFDMADIEYAAWITMSF